MVWLILLSSCAYLNTPATSIQLLHGCKVGKIVTKQRIDSEIKNYKAKNKLKWEVTK